jgi:hypothetical protein
VGAWAFVESQTLASAASSVVMSGLDTAYRMFRQTVTIVNDGTASGPSVRDNNDSGNNYDEQRLSASDATVGAQRVTAQAQWGITPTTLSASQVGLMEFTVAKQVASSPAMMVMARKVNTAPDGATLAGRWNNTTDLISRIDWYKASGDFAANTAVKLEAA